MSSSKTREAKAEGALPETKADAIEEVKKRAPRFTKLARQERTQAFKERKMKEEQKLKDQTYIEKNGFVIPKPAGSKLSDEEWDKLLRARDLG